MTVQQALPAPTAKRGIICNAEVHCEQPVGCLEAVAVAVQRALLKQAPASPQHEKIIEDLPLITGLYVENVGDVALPISQSSPLCRSEQLLTAFAEPEFRFANPAWGKTIKQAAASLSQELDIPNVRFPSLRSD
jgi:hypothetical protein